MKNMHDSAIDLITIDGDAVITKARLLIKLEDPVMKMIGVAALTGRRMAEIAKTMTFSPARKEHHTNEIYWSHVEGIVKQRGPNPLLSAEIPIFAPLPDIQNAVNDIRRKMPCETIEDVNATFSTEVSRKMRKYCAVIGKLHQFRKFYVLMCDCYFNERSCALWRIAHDYLCHKTVNTHVLTYMNFKVHCNRSLDFGKGKLFGKPHPEAVTDVLQVPSPRPGATAATGSSDDERSSNRHGRSASLPRVGSGLPPTHPGTPSRRH
jgi:hypothetical protein